ncbi:MAG TPA: FAD-binding oxidoreductase [Solirubrobacteraceae bacterium]|nr:FAD-binding oxidoreductase [Solirubrobacteraceae bacterium]
MSRPSTETAGAGPAAPADDNRRGEPRLLSGWGLTARSRATVHRPGSAKEVAALLADSGPRGAIARGLGRAYGDAAQNAGGAVIDTRGLAAVRDLDLTRGRATVEAGVSLDALISALLPLGWFPDVVPGTRFVTVGGAIASDIHGKNHHRDGAFGDHVLELELLTPAGERIRCSPDDRPEVFAATTGGMGLTGVVVAATVRLSRVQTSWMRVDTERTADLDDALARMEARDDQYRYSVAWIDCLARGSQLGRSVLFRGDHAGLDELPPERRESPLRAPSPPQLAAPPWVPDGLLRRSTVAAFNEIYFRRAPRAERGRLESLERFFFPLDAIRGWNRMYGPRGFLQYQMVVPFGAEDTLRAAIERLSGARCASFLAVLKRFGRERGLLSFPMPGWTLALDVPAGAPGLAPLLDGLDELVAQAGGRVYLSKDSRLRPELVAHMYPRLGEWREIRAGLDPEGRMHSDLARRLGLVAARPTAEAAA